MSEVLDKFNNSEFEQNKYQEIERKFIPKQAEQFDTWKEQAVDITQLYVSHLDEPYSLRLRKIIDINGEEIFTATIKDRGTMTENGLARFEVETPISQAAFEHYFTTEQYPVLFKKRAIVCPGVTIDWIEGSVTPIIEIENSQYQPDANDFLSLYQSELIERTGHSDVDNEQLAHAISGRQVELTRQTDTATIMNDIAAYRAFGINNIVIGIGGRSGSGKSTLAQELADQIIAVTHVAPIILSTDDYHRGRPYLEKTYGKPWLDWDAPEVYDTAAAADDLRTLRQGGYTVKRRQFDFTSETITYGELIHPNNIIILEGIYAASPDFADLRTMYFDAGTGLATSLGRDLQRFIDTDRPNGSIATPADRLKHVIEYSEPAYQRMERPPRNVFSASSRRLSRTAIENF